MKISDIESINPEFNEQIKQIALQRIAKRLGDLVPNERLDYIFEQPYTEKGVAFTKNFVRQLRLNFSTEEINNTFPKIGNPISKKNEKFDDFTSFYTKGKISSCSEYINIAAEQYLQKEMQLIINYLYKANGSKSALFTVMNDLTNPLND